MRRRMRILQGWGLQEKARLATWMQVQGVDRALLGREKLDGSFRRIGTADAATSAVTAPFSGR